MCRVDCPSAAATSPECRRSRTVAIGVICPCAAWMPHAASRKRRSSGKRSMIRLKRRHTGFHASAVVASVAKQTRVWRGTLDCFATLAMTGGGRKSARTCGRGSLRADGAARSETALAGSLTRRGTAVSAAMQRQSGSRPSCATIIAHWAPAPRRDDFGPPRRCSPLTRPKHRALLAPCGGSKSPPCRWRNMIGNHSSGDAAASSGRFWRGPRQRDRRSGLRQTDFACAGTLVIPCL